MKHILTFAGLTCGIALAASGTLLGQEAPAPTTKTNAPRVQFSETTFNFGKVQPTNVLIHEFIITNFGNAMLEITAVQPGCGCTTAGTWDRQVAPGKTGKIPIQFNPANFFGTVTKGVTVTCNDPVQATHHLQIQATIWRPVEVQPQYVHFMPVEGEETNETRVVRIINNQEDAITLQAPTSSTPVFKTELKTVKPGKEFELQVAYSGPISNAASQGSITINTSVAGLPPLTVNAFAMPQPALVAMPQHVQLPAGSPTAATYQYPVNIRNNGRAPIKISDPSVNVEGMKAEVQEIEPGKNFKVQLNIPAGFQAKPGQTMELSFKTTNPKYPVFKVPITQPAPVAPVPVVGPVVPAPAAGK
jgi:hypothetical protein